MKIAPEDTPEIQPNDNLCLDCPSSENQAVVAVPQTDAAKEKRKLRSQRTKHAMDSLGTNDTTIEPSEDGAVHGQFLTRSSTKNDMAAKPVKLVRCQRKQLFMATAALVDASAVMDDK